VRSVCIDKHSLSDRVKLAIGLAVFGCEAALEGCEPEITAGEGAYRVSAGGREAKICWERDVECDIVINQHQRGLYIHMLTTREPRRAYITAHNVDSRVFAGMLACLLSTGMDLESAFDKVMEILAMSPNPFEYLKLVLEENSSINRLIDSLDRLVKNQSIIAKIAGNILVLGVKPCERRAYIVKIYTGLRAPVVSPIERIDPNIHGEYSSIPPGSGFLCSDKPLTWIDREVTRVGYSFAEVNGFSCIVAGDVMRIVILLEKLA